MVYSRFGNIRKLFFLQSLLYKSILVANVRHQLPNPFCRWGNGDEALFFDFQEAP
jgi:hypothetical protein